MQTTYDTLSDRLGAFRAPTSTQKAMAFVRLLVRTEQTLDTCRWRNVVTVYSRRRERVFPAHDAAVTVRHCDDDVTVYTFTF